MPADNVLKFGLPKGSLEAQTIELMRKSGWRVSVGARSYMPSVDDPTLSCRLLRPQEMPRYIADGSLDAGITGSDWIVENAVELVEVESFTYSKVSLVPTRWVLAVPDASAVRRLEDLEGKRIATEMVDFTRRVFAERKVKVEVEFSWGATEAKAAEGLVDAVVEVSETGSTIRAHGLKIIHELMESCPQLIANKQAWQDQWKRAKIEQIKLLLLGALSAENRVGIKLNVAEGDLERVVELIPSITAPTVAPLHPSPNLKGIKWYSVESVLEEAKVRDLIPQLIQNGAVGIIEYPLNKII